ncbi:MAG TPA: hypothetical protein VE994_09115 [Terriglobales bacterium]|jgi:hypothetical protein|nr:hypothetical protein [Terriglobales bacterium]
MNSKLRSTSAVVIALVLMGAFAQSFVGDAAAHSNRDGRLQGTWRVQITPTNCQTGAPQPSFPMLLSFHRGGTLTEVIGSPAFLPGQRSIGLGVWSHARGNAYKGVWEGLMLFDSPAPGVFKRGVQRLQFDFEVYGDQLTIASTSQFIDINGNVYASTCASGTGTRFEEAAEDED